MHASEHSSLDDLVRRARDGDQQCRDRLFEACRSYLGVIAQAQVDTWLRAKVDASDLVQQTLLEAHRDFERFQGRTDGEWLAWLKKIMRHNAADFVRHYRGTQKRQARREVPLRHAGDDTRAFGAPDPQAHDPSPSQHMMAHDRQLQMADALAQLSDDHREVIMLRNLQRLPFDEVAQCMNRSRPAAQMLWMRAIKRLEQLMGLDAANPPGGDAQDQERPGG